MSNFRKLSMAGLHGPSVRTYGGREGRPGDTRSLPGRVGYPPLFTIALEKEIRVKPRASRPACLPALNNTGRPDCPSAAGTAVKEDEEMKEDEEDGTALAGGGADPCPLGW